MSSTKPMSILAVLLFGSLALAVHGCKVTSQSYSANDGLVLLHAAHILTFTADCAKEPVYANLDGRTLAVVRSAESNTFQVSWTNEIAKATSGSYEIAFYDEEGYQLYRKSQRSTGDVKPLFSIGFSHNKPYRGPMFQTEFVVLLIGILLSYTAIYYQFQIITKKI